MRVLFVIFATLLVLMLFISNTFAKEEKREVKLGMAINTNTIIVNSNGKLLWQGKEYLCALGRNGVSIDKKEGDGKTPVGHFIIKEIYYRKDKIGHLTASVPVKEISPTDGWCDDSNDVSYNKYVKLPYNASHENLWREDNLYDIIIVINYNTDSPIPGKGSAIFIHIARPGYSPTAGCIALSKNDLLEVIKNINNSTIIQINQ